MPARARATAATSRQAAATARGDEKFLTGGGGEWPDGHGPDDEDGLGGGDGVAFITPHALLAVCTNQDTMYD